MNLISGRCALSAWPRPLPSHWPDNSHKHSNPTIKTPGGRPASCFCSPQQQHHQWKHHAGPSSSTVQQTRIPAACQPHSANTPVAAAGCAQHSPAGSSRRLVSAAAWLCSIMAASRRVQQQEQPITAAAPAPQAQGAVLCRQKQQRRRRAQTEAAAGTGGHHKQHGCHGEQIKQKKSAAVTIGKVKMLPACLPGFAVCAPDARGATYI